MTLYGHFRTRAELVEAALVDALRAGEETLSRRRPDRGRPRRPGPPARVELVAGGRVGGVADGRAGRPARGAPARAARRPRPAQVEDLIRRGQRQGVFRTDLPISWLVSVVHYILKGAAEEHRAGRVKARDASGLVAATVQSILAVPAQP